MLEQQDEEKKMIISTDAKKPFDKTQHLLWQKILKTRNKGKLPWCNKAIYEKAIANIMLNSEKLKHQEQDTLTISTQHSTKVLAGAHRQEK